MPYVAIAISTNIIGEHYDHIDRTIDVFDPDCCDRVRLHQCAHDDEDEGQTATLDLGQRPPRMGQAGRDGAQVRKERGAAAPLGVSGC